MAKSSAKSAKSVKAVISEAELAAHVAADTGCDWQDVKAEYVSEGYRFFDGCTVLAKAILTLSKAQAAAANHYIGK